MDKTLSDMKQRGSRWMRVGLLALTMAGPVINTFLEQLRKRAQNAREQVQATQESTTDRLDELAGASRRRAAEQARQLQVQAQQLQKQARQLRNALRDEARQRKRVRKLTKQLRALSGEWSEELAERGSKLTHELTERGSRVGAGLAPALEKLPPALEKLPPALEKLPPALEKLSPALEKIAPVLGELTERGGKLTQDLSERGSKLAQGLAERGSTVGAGLAPALGGLAERGGKLRQDLADRGGQLLRPPRKRPSPLLTVLGFSVGLVTAGVVTYVVLRRRMTQQEIDDDQQIELAPRDQWKGPATERPAGEILYFENNGTSVATLQFVDVEEQSFPADALFVGIASTKHYYPVTTPLDRLPLPNDEAKELIYFASEEEARAQGFTADE